MRLVIGGPTRDSVPASFAVDLAQLFAYSQLACGEDAIALRFVGATYVHVGRNAALEAALQFGATHMLWLDTDMRFPKDTALRLAAHGLPVVAANCLMRDPRRIWTAKRGGQRIETKVESIGLQDVDSVGLAVMLMRTDVVASMRRPWFRHGWNLDTQSDIGEDVLFCQALRIADYPIYIDHDLSKEVGHIGQYTYRPASDAALAV